jgi:WD domain, G-beta repeat.
MNHFCLSGKDYSKLYLKPVLVGHSGIARTIVITSDNLFDVSSGKDNNVKIWNLIEKNIEAY